MPVAAKHGIDYKARSDNTFRKAFELYFKYIFDLNEIKSDNDKKISTSKFYGFAAYAAFFNLSVVVPAMTLW